jgi:hypothetical protein
MPEGEGPLVHFAAGERLKSSFSFRERLWLLFLARSARYAFPWHFLNFFPEPQGHASLRPTF